MKPRVVRTSEGVRDALFDALDGLRDGTCSTADALATAAVARQIYNGVRLELDAQDRKPVALRLGREA